MGAQMLDSTNHADIESLTSSLKHFCFCSIWRMESVRKKKAKIQLMLFQFVCVRITSLKRVPSSSHAKADNWPTSCGSWAGSSEGPCDVCVKGCVCQLLPSLCCLSLWAMSSLTFNTVLANQMPHAAAIQHFSLLHNDCQTSSDCKICLLLPSIITDRPLQ